MMSIFTKLRIKANKTDEKPSDNITLCQFINKFRRDIKTGDRLNYNGNLYAKGTINAINQALERFYKFEKYKNHLYDFDEIDLRFYNEYTAYLKKQDYSINTTGKCIKVLKQIMSLSESEGYHNNGKYKDPRFKGQRVDVDNIYLTKDDLAAIMAIDGTELTKSEILSRDIFMVGVWTAQRVSDYNHIHKDEIQTMTKRWIEDVPDPDCPGATKAEIRSKEITYINFRQRKTGTKVAIPCSSELKAILEKYDCQIPHQAENVLNKNMKTIGRKAGLTNIVEIEITKGGKSTIKKVEKCDLIFSHTARRTGATLMLKKYIKADQLEVIEKITEKYDYFD